MEGVMCPVECLADFGDLLSAKVMCHGTDVILSTRTENIFVFCVEERRVKSVLQFESPVTSLALSADQCSLCALCDNNLLYSTTVSPQPSSFSAEQGDDPALSVVSEDSVLVKDGNIRSIAVAEDILITVSLKESFWTFHFCELPRCLTSFTGFQNPAGFQVPAVTGFPQDDVDLQDRMSLAPTLTCFYPNSSPKGCARKHHPRLDPLLFRLLFGVDASLIDSPIILCGLPDGRLVFFPLFLPALTSSRGQQKAPTRIFYSLEQPVVFIGASVVGDHGPQCLVVIGQNGRILLISTNQRRSDGKTADCRFIEHMVQGPVVCACVDGEHLYYSTGTNLYCLSLSKILIASSSSSSSSSVTTVSEGDSTRPVRTVCLNVCRVIALTEPSISPAGCVQLLAVSLGGRLLQVTLPQDSDKAKVSRLTSSQAGQKIKDLLAGIGNVWERTTAVKQQLELKNNTLERLNRVLNICHLLLNSQKKTQEVCDLQPSFCCQAAAKWSTLLQKDSLVVTCTLENHTSYALDRGWTLCLQVQSSLSVSAGGSSRSYSFALTNLDCGQKAEVTLPLESERDLFLPVRIHCSLVYNLQSLLNPEEYRHLTTNDTSLSQLLTHTSCICLALNTLTLDWLDALQIGEPTTNADSIPKQISAWESINILLNSRRHHTTEPGMPKTAPHTVAVHISSELLRDRLSLQDCNAAQLCIAVLKWLLCGSSKSEGEMVVQNPVVCARGPDRQAVRLLTKEAILTDFRSDGPLSIVEVRVESVSMSAVCGLHHAVLRRVQALLNDSSAQPEKSAELRKQHLCNAVRHMESLYKDLQDLRDPAGGVLKTSTSESLFGLYLRLREKPMVIV
ncbi:Fanconi anemia core complex-associated protein 100 [Tachysurus fulvidraco]|uniref:Fanconi anemia core complex-associated protein 100 n=1 Tax=Tachysurus fulvidraco TaxID=1234273 RepID=UPI001FEFB5F7|nr:Fanconi anemia core complex-associated protein 100 [Tachysurus fulvidraco]